MVDITLSSWFRANRDHSTHALVGRFKSTRVGKGTLDITRTLNDEGIASPRGQLWGKTSVHAILVNEAYTGTLVWGTNSKRKADPVRVEKAFSAIVNRDQFDRVSSLMRSRAPKIVHPRRVGSPFLLTGLVKCNTCRRAFTGQYSKSPRYPYYVCQTLMKRGSGACDAPRLNARHFEEMVVEMVRTNVLTESCLPDLTKLVGEEVDDLTAEQRKRLQTMEAEIAEVKRQPARLWRFIETSDDVDVDDFTARIREHRDRQQRLEESAADANAVLVQRKPAIGDVNAIAMYAVGMTDFLDESELAEARAFVKSFVKEIVITAGAALLRYTMPMPDDSCIPGRSSDNVALSTSITSTAYRSDAPAPTTRSVD